MDNSVFTIRPFAPSSVIIFNVNFFPKANIIGKWTNRKPARTFASSCFPSSRSNFVVLCHLHTSSLDTHFFYYYCDKQPTSCNVASLSMASVIPDSGRQRKLCFKSSSARVLGELSCRIHLEKARAPSSSVTVHAMEGTEGTRGRDFIIPDAGKALHTGSPPRAAAPWHPVQMQAHCRVDGACSAR